MAKVQLAEPTVHKPRQTPVLLICLLLVAATLAAYSQLPECGFIAWDDGEYVVDNPQVKAGLTVDTIAWAFKETGIRYWHPLTWLSHMLDVELYGLNPSGHHWTNLLLHLANTLLLFAALRRLTGKLWQSALVAALFSLHPLHVESVAWVSERKDVLATFFGLLTILGYSRYLKTRQRDDYLLTCLLFGMGLMSKPSVVTLPFALLLLDFWPLRRAVVPCLHGKEAFTSLFRLFLEKTPLFLLSALACIVTFVGQQDVGLVRHFPLTERVSNALISYVKYAAKALWPLDLGVMYPHPGDTIPLVLVLGAAALLLGCAVLSIRLARKYPYICFGYFWYLGTLVPMIGLIQAGEHAMADRHSYIPLIGLFVIIAWGLSELSRNWPRRRSIAIAVGAASLSALGAAAFVQAGYWKNSITLFEHTLSVTQDNCLVHNDLATVLADEGRLDEAEHHYGSAIRIWPGYAKAHKGLADLLFTRHRHEEAILHYNEAIVLQPKYLEGYSNLAQLLYSRGEHKQAQAYLAKALAMDPEKDWLHSNMALVLTARGEYDGAVRHFREALRLNPEDAQTHYRYGTLLLKLSQREGARASFARSIRAEPDYAEAYYGLGAILIAEGMPTQARHLLKEALRLDPGHAGARELLLSNRSRDRKGESPASGKP